MYLFNRYGCVLAQYLPNQDSDFDRKEFRYWMITKCDPSYSNHEERDMCENPWLHESPESFVPVTDLRSHVHYRNKYCFHCSGDGNEASLVSWALKIVNNESISIPNQNLLGELRNQRGNIFFLKPEYVDVHRCDAQPYKISVCNETGQWKTYNRYIETACNSVLDPFNYTYKNYFCYLCNIEERLPEENWICRFNRTEGGDTVNPPFFAILDVAAVKGEPTRNQLHCGVNQFKDEIMVSIGVYNIYSYRRFSSSTRFTYIKYGVFKTFSVVVNSHKCKGTFCFDFAIILYIVFGSDYATPFLNCEAMCLTV